MSYDTYVCRQCSAVKLLLGASNPVHLAVLQKLCEQGWSHVLAQRSSTPSQQTPIRVGHAYGHSCLILFVFVHAEMTVYTNDSVVSEVKRCLWIR